MERIHGRTIQKDPNESDYYDGIMNQITTMAWSVTQSQTLWKAKSRGPEEALLLIKLVDMIEFQ